MNSVRKPQQKEKETPMNLRYVFRSSRFTIPHPRPSPRRHLVLWAVLTLILMSVFGCTPKPMVAYSPHTPPLILVPASAAGVVDGRSRFPEIYPEQALS
jgi:hypothetical protein